MDTHSSPAAAPVSPLTQTAMPTIRSGAASDQPSSIGARLVPDLDGSTGETSAPNLPNLPSWAANETGRALVAQILADPPVFGPDNRLTFGVRLGGDKYHGVPAARLRRLHAAESEKLLAIADAEHAAGKPWDEAVRTWTSFIHGEGVEDLISRVLEGRS